MLFMRMVCGTGSSFTLLFLLLCQGYAVALSTFLDPDTPSHQKEIRPFTRTQNGDEQPPYELIFSDEFQVSGRRFRDGDDPRWTAAHKNDFTNNPLHYYSHEAAQTNNGSLHITLDIQPNKDLATIHDYSKNGAKEYKEFRSGMLQSWNKFCFTGGIVEISAKMPGPSNLAGLWPAIWMMGNLGRATYVNTTENMWPFSTNVCDARTRDSQLVNSCEDDRGSILGMPVGQGRGAPEVDLLEVMYMDQYFEHPVLSTSLQVAPGVPADKRPMLGQEPNASNTWYSPEYGDNVTRNSYFLGTVSYPGDHTKKPYRTDSISANVALNDDFYNHFHTFRMEWEPPEEDGSGGYISWFIDGNLITKVHGDDLQQTSQTEIPSEPMYLVMNLAVSKDWGFPDAYFKNCPKKCWSCLDPACACALPKGFCANLPTTFAIDSVRVYQPAVATTTTTTTHSQYSRGCSPPKRPTKNFIAFHKDKYKLQADKEPLKEISVGGGHCQEDMECGTVLRGRCDSMNFVCVCNQNWTGPNCLAAHCGGALDDWNDPYSVPVPRGVGSLLFVQGLIALSIVTLCSAFLLRRRWDSSSSSKKQIYRLLSTTSSSNGTATPAIEDPEVSVVSFVTNPTQNYQHASYQKGDPSS